MDAVTCPVAVGAEEDAEVCALGQAVLGGGNNGPGDQRGGGRREDGGEEGKRGGSDELHFGEKDAVVGSAQWRCCN